MRLDIRAAALPGPTATVIAVVATSLVLVTAMVVLALRLRARRRLVRSARECVHAPPDRPLAEGPVTLAGTVEADKAGFSVIIVRLVQHCADPSWRRAQSFIWREVDRIVDIEPFTLVVHGTGERVRVVPDEHVQLMAAATSADFERGDGTLERRWRANLCHGEHCSVTGALSREAVHGEGDDYRGRAGGFVLRAAAGERLRVQAESAAVESARNAPRFGIPGALLLVAAILHVVGLGSYLVRAATAHGAPEVCNAGDVLLPDRWELVCAIALPLAAMLFFFPSVRLSSAPSPSQRSWYEEEPFNSVTYRRG